MGQKVRELLFQSHNPYIGFEPLPFNAHGWASNSPAFVDAIEEIKPELIIEVGTWMGGSSRTMAELCKIYSNTFEIVCIDTFLGSEEMWTRQSYLMSFDHGRPTVYDHFISNTIHAGLTEYITPFPVDSINGFLTLKKFGVVPDLIYIDAGHDYDSVKADLERWSEILRQGGMILGDDWHHPPIKKAVADVFGLENIVERGDKFSWIKK